MAEITGGELNYVVTADVEQLKKMLSDGEGRLVGFSNVAEKAGEKLDTALKGTATESLKELANEATKTGSTLKSVGDVKIDFGLTKENLAIQKQVIAEIKKNIEEIEKRAKGMAPGMAQASVLGELKPLQEELAAEEKALASLEVEMKKTAVSATTLSSKYLEAKNRLAELTLANKQGTPEYVKAEAEVRKYGTALSDTNARAKALTAGTIGGLAQGLSLITGTMATGTALLGAFGGKSEELNQIMLKTQALLAATVTLQEIKNTTVQKGGVISGIMAVQEMARSRATSLATVNTIRATIAQKALNLVANANPYILLATAILTVVGALALYVSATNKAEAETKKLIDLNKKIADSVAEPLVAYKNLQSQWNALGNDLKAKEKFIKDNKDEFAKLGVEVNNVNDAENVLRKNSQAFVQAMMLRAKSAALAQIAIENMKRSLELESEYKRKNIDKNLTVGEIAMRTLTDGPGGVASRQRAKNDAEEVRKSKQKDVDLAAEQLKVEKELEALNSKSNFRNPAKNEKEKVSGKSKTTAPKNIADEYFPPGSVAEIQKRMSAIDEALSKATNSGTIETLKNKRISLAEELAEAVKRIEIKSLEDRANEQEKFANAYLIIEQNLGKEAADKMYGPLMEGAQSYYGWLTNEQDKLFQKQSSEILTEKDKSNLVFLTQKIDEIQGKKNAFQNFTEGIDEALSKIPTLAGQIEFLQNKAEEQLQTKGKRSFDDGEQKYLQEQADQREKQLKDNYRSFLNEHQNYEEQRLKITTNFDELRKQAQSQLDSGAISEPIYQEIIIKINKEESATQTDLFFQEMSKSEEWVKVFTDMNLVATTKLEEFKRILQTKLSEAKTIEEKIKIGEFLARIDDTLVKRNPLKTLSESIAKYIQNIKELKQAQDEYNASIAKYGANSEQAAAALKKLQKVQSDTENSKKEAASGVAKGASEALGYIKDVKGIITDVKGAFDDLGVSLDNGFGDALEKLEGYLAGMEMQMDGMMMAAEGFITGNPVKIVAGAIKAVAGLVKSISSIFNNDRKKERDVKKQQEILNGLTNSYNELAFAADRAFGSKKYDGQRDLIKNLQEQKIAIEAMMRAESSKKKKDKDKIAGYQQQIQSINQSIASLKEGIIKDVLQTDIVDAAAKLGDALVENFGRGEDAIKAVENAANDMIKNLLKNQLNLMLQNRMKPILDKLLKDAGFNQDGTGSFAGLTPEQIADFKAQVAAAGESMNGFLEAYGDIFAGLESPAEGLKVDIKGITERTAGALEAQVNALRIYQVEGLNIQKSNQLLFVQSLQNLVLIEYNTRPLHRIDKNIEEMNGKMSKNLVGLP